MIDWLFSPVFFDLSWFETIILAACALYLVFKGVIYYLSGYEVISIKGAVFLVIFFGSIWISQAKYGNTVIPGLVFIFWIILGFVAHKAFNAGREYERKGESINDYDPSGNDNVRRKFWDYM
jgi:hypothetical protein